MLEVQNQSLEDRTPTNSMVNVPIRCACPDGLDKSNGTNYLVTYPVAEGDNLSAIAWKFNVSEDMIWNANSLYSLGPNPTIFTQTTLLIPTKEIPALVTFFAPSLNPSPGSTTAIISSSVPKRRNPRLNIAYIVLGVVVFTSIVLLIVSFLFIRSTRNRGQQNSESSSPRSFQLSNLSQDLLDDVSKLKQPLFNYSFDELKTATGDFSEASKISKSLYRGTDHGSGMVIKQVNSAEAHRVIEILTTINHINIVKLQGCCHMNQPYLVFELAANGSLRNCLSDPLLARQLTWLRRMEIAFDITVALHYIHCCTKPCYVHRNINSRIILITADWRAKISGFGMAKPLPQNNNEKDDSETNKWKDTIMVGRRGYLAPEYLYHSLASPKVDVFALGMVLLELISGREAVGSGCMLKDSVGFLVGGLEGSSICLEKLRGFMDPCLEGDYQLGDALCLALLAKSCLDEDPLRRPTMNGVLKALSRMV